MGSSDSVVVLGPSWDSLPSSDPMDLFKAQSRSVLFLPSHGSSLFRLWPVSWCPCPCGSAWCPGLRALGWAVEAVSCPPAELLWKAQVKLGRSRSDFKILTISEHRFLSSCWEWQGYARAWGLVTPSVNNIVKFGFLHSCFDVCSVQLQGWQMC